MTSYGKVSEGYPLPNSDSSATIVSGFSAADASQPSSGNKPLGHSCDSSAVAAGTESRPLVPAYFWFP